MRGSLRKDYFEDDWNDRRTKIKYVVKSVSTVCGICLLFTSIPMFVISIGGYTHEIDLFSSTKCNITARHIQHFESDDPPTWRAIYQVNVERDELEERMALPITYGDSGLRESEEEAMRDRQQWGLHDIMDCYTPDHPVVYDPEYKGTKQEFVYADFPKGRVTTGFVVLLVLGVLMLVVGVVAAGIPMLLKFRQWRAQSAEYEEILDEFDRSIELDKREGGRRGKTAESDDSEDSEDSDAGGRRKERYNRNSRRK